MEEEEERVALRAVQPHKLQQRCRHSPQQLGMRAGEEDTTERQQQQERPFRREEGEEAEEEALMGQFQKQTSGNVYLAEELHLQHLQHLRCH